MATWKALPGGEDVPLSPGSTYAVVASVSSSTTRAKIDSALAKYFPGLSILAYVEQGESGGPPSDPDTDRKQIAAVVKDASFTGKLSWSKSIPIVAPDIYTLSGAWVLEGSSSESSLPESPWAGALPVRRPGSPWPWIVLGTLALGGTGFALYHYQRALRDALRGVRHG